MHISFLSIAAPIIYFLILVFINSQIFHTQKKNLSKIGIDYETVIMLLFKKKKKVQKPRKIFN